MIKGRCTNLENVCSKAQNQEVIELYEYQDFKCPECNSELTLVREPRKKTTLLPKNNLVLLGVILLVFCIGGVLWWQMSNKKINSDNQITNTNLKSTTPVEVQNLKDSILNALDNSDFVKAKSLSKSLIDEIILKNGNRESLVPFYQQIKMKADNHFNEIVLKDKDCNRIDIPIYFYICAYILSPNSDEADKVNSKRRECEEFSQKKCDVVYKSL